MLNASNHPPGNIKVVVSHSALQRGIAQLVARIVRDDEAAGSSPATPTNRKNQSGFSATIIFFDCGSASGGESYQPDQWRKETLS